MIDEHSRAAIDALIQWLLSPASRGLPFERTVVEICERIVASGFSLWRTRILLFTHHPEVLGMQFEWKRGGTTSTMQPFAHDILSSAAYRGSAVELVQTGGQRVRVHLERPEERARFAQLDELAAEGATDYIAEPLHLSDGRISCMTLATQRPGGFTEADLALLDAVAGIIAFRLELRSVQHAMQSLLDIYLGPNASRRVLAGAFRRGSGESLRAAIWWCDMRGFTTIADRLPAREVVAMLDRFFEPIVDAVERAGGEILKFIGDAALAVFPVEGNDERAERAACRQALAAAEGAMAELSRHPPADVSMVVALHLGEVFYGNIGGRNRLDFTVIGSAVNEAARLEALSKRTGVPLVMSQHFAAALDDPSTVSLGVHPLRGVSAPIEVFTLASLAKQS